MELVAILTIEQKDSLVGQLVTGDRWGFNPVLSGGTLPWIISKGSIDASTYPQHAWVKTLPLVEYNIPIIPSGTTS